MNRTLQSVNAKLTDNVPPVQRAHRHGPGPSTSEAAMGPTPVRGKGRPPLRAAGPQPAPHPAQPWGATHRPEGRRGQAAERRAPPPPAATLPCRDALTGSSEAPGCSRGGGKRPRRDWRPRRTAKPNRGEDGGGGGAPPSPARTSITPPLRVLPPEKIVPALPPHHPQPLGKRRGRPWGQRSVSPAAGPAPTGGRPGRRRDGGHGWIPPRPASQRLWLPWQPEPGRPPSGSVAFPPIRKGEPGWVSQSGARTAGLQGRWEAAPPPAPSRAERGRAPSRVREVEAGRLQLPASPAARGACGEGGRRAGAVGLPRLRVVSETPQAAPVAERARPGAGGCWYGRRGCLGPWPRCVARERPGWGQKAEGSPKGRPRPAVCQASWSAWDPASNPSPACLIPSWFKIQIHPHCSGVNNKCSSLMSLWRAVCYAAW